MIVGLKEAAQLQQLKWVYLGKTKITDACIAGLAKLQNLEQVHLTDTKITKAGVAELKKALPNCKITGP